MADMNPGPQHFEVDVDCTSAREANTKARLTHEDCVEGPEVRDVSHGKSCVLLGFVEQYCSMRCSTSIGSCVSVCFVPLIGVFEQQQL